MRRLCLAAVGITVAAATLAGCGTSPSATVAGNATPARQVDAAFRNLLAGNSLTSTLRVGLSPAQIRAFATSSPFGSDPVSSHLIQEIAGGRLSLMEHNPKGSLAAALSSRTAARAMQLETTFADDNNTLVDVRYLSGTVYARAEVPRLLTLFQQPSSVFDQLQAEARRGPKFVKAAIAGDWLSLRLSTLRSVLRKLPNLPATTPAPTQQRALMTRLRQLITKDVTVIPLSTTTDGGAYLLSGNSRTLLTAFVALMREFSPQLSDELGRSFDPDKVPSQTVKLGLTISAGKVSQLSLDLTQFGPRADGLPASQHFPIDLDFSTAAFTVARPTGATPFDLGGLASLLTPSSSALTSAA